jgi:hypothetical protein
MKLIKHFTKQDQKRLQNKINNPGVYDMPTMDEVVEYLESTEDDEPSEEVIGDLVIQYLEGEGLMFGFC